RLRSTDRWSHCIRRQVRPDIFWGELEVYKNTGFTIGFLSDTFKGKERGAAA
ncbi:unnamed protein product, partial [Ectocarpus sp. 12 AP-2014]